MLKITFPYLIVPVIILALVSASPKLVLHLKDNVHPFTLTEDHCGSGVYFTNNQEFNCACVTGLWALYEENCDQAKLFLAGSGEQCTPLNFKLKKANLLSPSIDDPSASSAIVFDRGITSIGEKFVSIAGTPRKSNFVPDGYPVIITTGRQTWRLPNHKKCMKPIYQSGSPHFCIFSHNVEEKYIIEDVDCFTDDEVVAPLKCVTYMTDADFGTSNPRACVDTREHHRVRRQVHQSISGRAFLQAINEMGGQPAAVNLTENDENSKLAPMGEQPILNSEMWNYMTLKAQERLGIRERRELGSTDSLYSPGYSFLNLAKKVQQKNCPDHYVPDAHYDVAVGAFIAIQRNHFKSPAVFVDFATTERIEEALNACINNISDPYPFLEIIGKKDEIVECNDSKPIAHGSYFKFNEILELKLSPILASRSNEPMIETVWKTFVHAHSACYPFFKNNYNDHHLFATTVLSLFTNEMHDIWFNVTELKPDIYSGFLGNAVELMDSVAYCSMFSRLESDYPWDLPRPKKNNARRKKRQVDTPTKSYMCVSDMDAHNLCRDDAFGGYKEGSGNRPYFK